ncbi:MAG: hypothetical protein AAF564_26465 [Bacteroidota bacterium]
MRFPIIPLFLTFLFISACTQPAEQVAVTEDVTNFWKAYDQITAVSDSATQFALIDSLFIAPGTPGLQAIMQRRGYTAASYIDAINSYPEFWVSVRPNTLRAEAYAEKINAGVEKLRAIYPTLQPARVYFTMGALMTNGMTLDDVVFIGSEVAMADSAVVTDELPGRLGENLRVYFDANPITHIAFLNVHEYVHTQQSAFGNTLVQIALQEGVAEYIAVLATEKISPTPAVAFGQANEPAVRDRFITEMFSPNINDWLYNNFSNDFEMRDMGYYVGYAIAEGYYAKAPDKAQAIAELIELDYQNLTAVEAVVDASGYFPQPMRALQNMYEANRPRVVRVTPFDAGTAQIASGATRLTIQFSRPMSPRFRGFDYGPLGEDNVMRIQQVFGWSDDGTALEVEVNLKPAHRQQMTLTSQFRAPDGAAIEPFLIDVTTR